MAVLQTTESERMTTKALRAGRAFMAKDLSAGSDVWPAPGSDDTELRCIAHRMRRPSATDEHRTSVSHPCVNYFTLRNSKGLPWVDVKLVSLRREFRASPT